MLVDQHLKRLCKAVLEDRCNDEEFGSILVEAGVRLEGSEWDIATKLLCKTEEIFHAAGGKDKRTVH